MTTITATKARSNLFQILKKIAKGYPPTRISCKDGGVIMMSEDEYNGLMETMYLESIPGFKESLKEAQEEIKKGKVHTFEEVFGEKL